METVKTDKTLAEEKKPLIEVLPAVILNNVLTELYEKRSPEGYPEVTRMVGTQKYIIKATEYDLNQVMKNASESCKLCSYGKGYYVSYLDKKKYPEAYGFMTFKPEMEVPEGLPEEQKKIYLEMVKKRYEESSCWKILNVCHCATKNTLKKNKDIVSNTNNNIFIKLDYVIEETGGVV
jgi:hypothetical protein